MAWVRLDSKIINKDWIADLTDAEFRAWVHLIAFAADFEGDGVIPISSDKRLAECLHVPLKVLRSLLLRAELLQKIERNSETSWLQVRNYSKYNPQYLTNKRVEKFRENKELAKKNSVTATVTRNSNVTKNDNEYDTITNTSKEIPPNPLKGDESFSESETDVLFKWNELANQFPKIPKVIKLSETRKTHVKQRLLESEFDLDKILSGIRGSPFLTGQTNGFKVTFDWVFSSKNNYLKVLEGNYGNANGHEPEISEARKQLLEWSKANS